VVLHDFEPFTGSAGPLHSLLRRSDYSGLDLKSVETFLWIGKL
jgi:hypothetical protein